MKYLTALLFALWFSFSMLEVLGSFRLTFILIAILALFSLAQGQGTIPETPAFPFGQYMPVTLAESPLSGAKNKQELLPTDTPSSPAAKTAAAPGSTHASSRPAAEPTPEPIHGDKKSNNGQGQLRFVLPTATGKIKQEKNKIALPVKETAVHESLSKLLGIK